MLYCNISVLQVWSLTLIIWPLIIFIIIAVTRRQFPPIVKETCKLKKKPAAFIHAVKILYGLRIIDGKPIDSSAKLRRVLHVSVIYH